MPQSCPNPQLAPRHMPTAPPRIAEEPGFGRVEIFSVATDEKALFTLIKHVFEAHWASIFFVTLIKGWEWEGKAPGPPRRIGLLDGYVTVDFGPWHFHLCIGETKGIGAAPTPPALAQHRRCARAELYRGLNSKTGAPNTWGFRMFN